MSRYLIRLLIVVAVLVALALLLPPAFRVVAL